MTFLVERVAELQMYLRHARSIRTTISSPADVQADLTKRNDVVHSLLMIAQLVIDISGELAARRGERFETYRQAIAALAADERFRPALASFLERLAGFRNVVVHEYAGIDYARVIEALQQLEPVEEFVAIVSAIEQSQDQ